ncbi:Phage antirepressor protein YoqD, KilAC domain [Luteibacter sp. UNC138MFCol5.1]|uniref:phage antirepressor KilAC domain-containing protein n=1 Tax=Luteibacter sp. UNC138MFCol5.1 TaxID=1502774 RepID=UPI0008CD369D|nr:phage antirepressor KilAC domain-containing protein [Luteibacter sp. UNC138MFCol5.1]SEO63215.1 Phage antirepressor protein YoqD, KilAC domain [Luteibacter sp. UNC138MFCol5.1]
MKNLIVAQVGIRRDAEGRYSLNDLHRAAGGEKRHGPGYWLASQQTQDLVAELTDTGIPVSVQRGGVEQGTFVVKELVYAYAMWISPAFHLKVIRAYDAPEPTERDMLKALNDPEQLRGVLLGYTEKVLALEGQVKEMEPTVVAFRRIAGADGSLCLREAAKALQMPERKLAQWMHEKEWLFRGPKGGWMGYADKTKAGFLTHKVHAYFDEKVGEDKVSHQVRVTPAGLAKLAKMLGVELAEEYDAG